MIAPLVAPRARATPRDFSPSLPSQRERDGESGLMHYRARSYDPRTGRFVQTEPILKDRANTHYVYGRLAPVAAKDPTGFTTEVTVDDKRINVHVKMELWSRTIGRRDLSKLWFEWRSKAERIWRTPTFVDSRKRSIQFYFWMREREGADVPKVD